MSIEIYDKAAIVKKSDTFYLLLKHGSKNSFMNGGQSRIEGDFRRKFHARMTRDSEWRVIAIGDGADMDAAGICPASIDGETGKPTTEGETAHKWEPQLSSEDYNNPVYACSECGALKDQEQ
jgi:hypothetical protein